MSWTLKRIKDVAYINISSLSNNTDPNYIFKYIDIGNVSQNGIIQEPELVSFKDSPSRARRIVRKDDVIVSTVRTYLKAVAYFEEDIKNTIVSTGFAVLTSKPNIVSKYLAYKILSDSFIDKIIINSTGVSYPAINSSQINDLEIELPPLKEQTQIANYLNAKTTAIDKKIKLLKQKIKHYKAYRKTLINETVTKGLDKSVQLKDSGINWSGEIPAHWEVKRLKDVSKIFTGNSISDKSMFETKKDSFDYIATKDINIHNKKVNYDNGIYIPKKDKRFKITKKDTSLICLEGASAGNKLTFVDREVAFVNKLCAIKSTDKNVYDKYIFYQLQSNLFRSQFFELLSGLIGGVSLGLLKYFNVVIPSINEQQQIADFLDAKTNTVDNIVNNIETQISTLKELRKTLINEVVTGKVKVTA